MFCHAHLDIFILVDAFLEIQESSYTKMLSTDGRGDADEEGKF